MFPFILLEQDLLNLTSAKWMNHPLLAVSTSLASQTPYFSEERERGSGNTAYRKFSQAKECGASNQIASF